MLFDLTNFTNETGSVTNILDQLVYIINESENLFYVQTLDRPDYPERQLSRLLLTLAILNRSGYLSNSNTSGSEINSNSYESIFVYSQENDFLVRNHPVFHSAWCRNQSGYYSYLVK